MIENFKQMPIAVYEKLLEIDKTIEDDTDKLVARVCVVTGKSEDEINAMTALAFGVLASQLAFLNNPIPEVEIRKRYDIGGFKLVPTKDIFKMTTAQFVDFTNFAKQTDNFVEILSCFLVPAGKRYHDGYDAKEVQEAIRTEMSIADANALYVFFFRRLLSSLRAILLYSVVTAPKEDEFKEQREQLKEAVQELMRSLNAGGGKMPSITSLTPLT